MRARLNIRHESRASARVVALRVVPPRGVSGATARRASVAASRGAWTEWREDERRLPANAAAAAGWTAILLAGERPGGDPLAARFGVASKALIRIAGASMIRRVADTLLATPEIARVVILAQDPAALLTGDAAHLAADPRVFLAKSGSGISSSIAAVAGSDIAPWPVLVATADHPLLNPGIVREFLAAAQDCDVAVGVGERGAVEGRYPEARRTWLKFVDGHFSGANLFALRNRNAERALTFWSGIERDRKKAWKLISRFGPVLLVRALTRTIRFETAVARAASRLGLSARPVILSAPEAAIDVDKMEDFELVEAILSGRAPQPWRSRLPA
jgi:GTP:adenosylcobinamide-phosphate guanylyltransferase